MKRIWVVIAVLSLLMMRAIEIEAQHQVHIVEPEAPPMCRQNTYVAIDVGIENIAFDEKYPDESAVYFIDSVILELYEDNSFVTKVHKQVKILKESAKSWGEMPIYYDKGREKIEDLVAYTVTPDGLRHDYSKTQDFKVYEGYPMYSDSMMKVITFPEVNVGSVLNVEYTKVTKSTPIKGAFWESLYLYSFIPIKELVIEVKLPKKLNVQYQEFNLEHKPVVTEDGAAITYSWRINDIEVSEEELGGFLPPPNIDTISDCVQFSSIPEWSDVSNWYHEATRKNLKITRKIRLAAEKALEGKTTLDDKVRAILEYVQENFRYVSMSFGENAFEPHPTDKIFRNKYGDCKDLSLLTMAMLEVAGIKTKAALFNDEFSITDPSYDIPMPPLFTHVLLLVENPDGDDFYIDPLLNGFDLREYPLYYQNAYTFVITDDGGYFKRFPIFDEMREYDRKDYLINIEEDGSAITEITGQWGIDDSIEIRDYLKDLSEERRKEVFEMLEGAVTNGGEMLENRLDGIDDKYGSLTGYFKIQEKEVYPVTDDMMIINIDGYSYRSSFVQKERTRPIFNPANYKGERFYTYHIPDNFEISHLPKDLDLDSGIMSYQRSYQVKDKEITVKEITRWKRAELPVEDYQEVKDFFNEIERKTTQRIMLKKSNSWWLRFSQWWYDLQLKILEVSGL